MDNVNNPYLGIAEFVKSSNTQGFSFCIGKIISLSPLIAEGNRLSFSGDDLYVNDELLPKLTAGCKVLLLISDDKQTIVIVCKLRRG